MPPSGQLYSTRPIDAAEAGIRRKERFQILPTPIDVMVPPELEANAIFPLTLDLRLSPLNQKIPNEARGVEP